MKLCLFREVCCFLQSLLCCSHFGAVLCVQSSPTGKQEKQLKDADGWLQTKKNFHLLLVAPQRMRAEVLSLSTCSCHPFFPCPIDTKEEQRSNFLHIKRKSLVTFFGWLPKTRSHSGSTTICFAIAFGVWSRSFKWGKFFHSCLLANLTITVVITTKKNLEHPTAVKN